VLHLINSSGFFGADNALIELSKQMRRTTFSPTVGVFKNLRIPHLEVAEVAKRYDLPVLIFPCRGKLDIRTILSIRNFLRTQKIGIVHSHGYKSNFYALTASFGKNLSLVTTCHSWLGEDLKMKLYARLDKSLLNRFDKVVAVSDTLKQEILNHNISSTRVLTIHNGIDVDRFNSRKRPDTLKREFGIDHKCRIIGTVGRLSEEKGHSHLLRAADNVLRTCPDVVFLIVGDGPLRKNLQDKALQLAQGGSVNPFLFTGVRNDMEEIYSLMDIFVLPSLTEGLPMVLLEAMAAQKPVVATKVGAVPRVIDDGHSGLLISPGDVESLSEAIIDLLEDPQKAQHLAQNGYKRVRDHFSAKRMAEQYVEVYKDVLRARQQKS
jgi:glycosyltransferase involved in cell wall biosynthesis